MVLQFQKWLKVGKSVQPEQLWGLHSCHPGRSVCCPCDRPGWSLFGLENLSSIYVLNLNRPCEVLIPSWSFPLKTCEEPKHNITTASYCKHCDSIAVSLEKQITCKNTGTYEFSIKLVFFLFSICVYIFVFCGENVFLISMYLC